MKEKLYKTKIGKRFGNREGDPIKEGYFMSFCARAQYNAKTIRSADAMFKEGCEICSGSYGFRTECDNCIVAVANAYYHCHREGEVEDFSVYAYA